MKKTLILTSEKNFAWSSMQEIIPFINDTWLATAGSDHEVRIVNVDTEKLSSYFSFAMMCDNIVSSCFNPAMFKTIAYLRRELKLQFRLFIHLHNQASIACWPMRYWGHPQLFNASDIFISSCSRDAECLKVAYPMAQVRVIPFSYREYDPHPAVPMPTSRINFIFFGRISVQKNLHTLIKSFSIFKKDTPELKWQLRIIGREDNLGSPNMGIPSQNYLQELQDITQQLGLIEEVTFEDFKNRSEIDQILQESRQIFVVPSLHSDENFGMAAFKSLIGQHLAVLSDWGGHTDLKINFPSQVELCPVWSSDRGPCVDAKEFAGALKKASEKYAPHQSTQISEKYNFANIVMQTLELAHVPLSEPSLALKASTEADRILARIPNDLDGKNPQIFDSYTDPTVTPFFRAYGMRTIG